MASLGALLSATALGAGQSTKLPDLVVSRLSDPPSSLAKSFTANTRVANVGNARAGTSKTVFHLSTDTKLRPSCKAMPA